tara:strand:+ start:9104 stop:10078 length:975 start_codon:yes stop_codon:yes gene_type:complete
MNKQKVIIWGFKPENGVLKNTISYVWNSFYLAFKYLDYDVHWFPNEKIDNFDFSNCIFISEAYDDSEMPLNKTSVYFVHCAYDPSRYIGKVKKFIDMRYNLKKIDHPNYVYELDKEKTKMDKGCYYEPSTNQTINFKNKKVSYEIEDFDKVYIGWATNLLPNEINEEDVYYTRSNDVYFLGSLSSDGKYANVKLIEEFGNECKKNNIGFGVNSFVQNQLSEEDYIRICKESLLGFDVRCENDVEWGRIPCRLYKNMSYGHLGLTNCYEAYKELDEHCLYRDNPVDLFYAAMEKKDDYEFIKDGLNYIKEYHTYVNRVQSLLKVI